MKIKLITILLGVLILVFSLRNLQAERLNVVTTLPSLASIAESIGGDYVKVYSITRGIQDAHYVDAKPSYMLKLHKADLLIYSGLELEIGWLPLLIQGSRNNKVTVGSRGNLNASMVLETGNILEKPRGEVDRSMGDVHPSGNPHYLLNPYNGIRIAELISVKLIELDSRHKDQYTNNLQNFKILMESKIKELEDKAEHLKGMNVVCYHVHWSYLLDWLGLNPAGYIELRPGIPPTPKHKEEIIQLMKEKQIKVVIISSWKEPTKATEVANSVGARLVILPGEVKAYDNADNYMSWVEYMVDHLIEAFSIDLPNLNKNRRNRQHERKRGTK